MTVCLESTPLTSSAAFSRNARRLAMPVSGSTSGLMAELGALLRHRQQDEGDRDGEKDGEKDKERLE
jgi:hypothetical protein